MAPPVQAGLLRGFLSRDKHDMSVRWDGHGKRDTFTAQTSILALEQWQARSAAREKATAEPVAIIGIGCRFPGGAEDPNSFGVCCNKVCRRHCLRSFKSMERRDAQLERRAYRWNERPRSRRIPKDVDRFEPGFFGISPREAVSLDPQQRLLLEVARGGYLECAVPS
jgi:hypothetical protein